MKKTTKILLIAVVSDLRNAVFPGSSIALLNPP